MRKEFKNWNAFYQQFSLVYHGIIAFSLLPFGWVFLDIEKGSGGLQLLDGNRLLIFDLVLGLIIGLTLLATYQRTKQSIDNIEVDNFVRVKLGLYYRIKLLRFFIYEGMAIVCIIAAFANGDFFFVLAYLFILFMFSLDRPRYDKVVGELKLNKKEQQQLESENDLE